MAQLSKKELLEEAKKQSEALKRISRWRTYAMVLSAIGVAAAYMGFTGSEHRTAVGVTGVVLILAGVVLAVIFNMVIRTGRENVEKILNAAEK
jgi:drug/metabolite transporter (DMT)-like permease